MDFRKDIKTLKDLAAWRKAWVDFRVEDANSPGYKRPGYEGHREKSLEGARRFRDAKLIFVSQGMREVIEATVNTLGAVDLNELLPSKEGIIWWDVSEERLAGLSKVEKEGYVGGVHWQMDADGGLTLSGIMRMSDYIQMWSWGWNGTYLNYTAKNAKALKKEFGEAPHALGGISIDQEQVRLFAETGKLYGYKTDFTDEEVADLSDEDLAVYREVGRVEATDLTALMVRMLAATLVLGNSKNIPETVQTSVQGAVGQRSKPFKDTVSVVSLRHIETREASTHGGRVLTCRFIVGGHFRNQPYKSTGEVKRIFIDPYIKGPADAPLKVNRPVYKL